MFNGDLTDAARRLSGWGQKDVKHALLSIKHPDFAAKAGRGAFMYGNGITGRLRVVPPVGREVTVEILAQHGDRAVHDHAAQRVVKDSVQGLLSRFGPVGLCSVRSGAGPFNGIRFLCLDQLQHTGCQRRCHHAGPQTAAAHRRWAAITRLKSAGIKNLGHRCRPGKIVRLQYISSQAGNHLYAMYLRETFRSEHASFGGNFASTNGPGKVVSYAAWLTP